MYCYEEIIEGRKLTEIINTTHENVKYVIFACEFLSSYVAGTFLDVFSLKMWLPFLISARLLLVSVPATALSAIEC